MKSQSLHVAGAGVQLSQAKKEEKVFKRAFSGKVIKLVTVMVMALLLPLAPASAFSTETKLTASDGAVNDEFGFSVSISGNTAVVGAIQLNNNGPGAAYVFVRSRTGWTQQAKLTASDGAAQDLFGWSVSISGGTAVVGAQFDDDKGVNSGSAYVFVRSGTGWSQQDKLTATDRASLDLFGWSVSISGNTALVGAIFDDGLGSVYVYKLMGN